MLYGIAVAEAAQSTRFEIARPTDKYVEVAYKLQATGSVKFSALLHMIFGVQD
jgi:hypothetical protein